MNRQQSYSKTLIKTFIAFALITIFCITILPESHAYKIEIDVSGPRGGNSVSEENGRTEIQLDTGPLRGLSGETGSASAEVNLATGSLTLEVSATAPDHSSHPGLGLGSIHITDYLTFKLDPGLPFADVKFSMKIDGSPTCANLSSTCFTNAIIRLGDLSDQALGLPLPDPNELDTTVTVTDKQLVRIEAFLSARVETNALISNSNPRATIRLDVPKGVSFSSDSGVFLGLQPPLSESPPRAYIGSDLNGDGKADIVWRNVRTGDVAVWLMNGGTIGTSGFLGGVPPDWQIEEVDDMNADGMADIVWHNTVSGAVAIWYLNGLTIASVSFPGGASTEWEMKGVGDMDGNGKADIIWQNTKNGAVTVWLMNGTTITAFRALAGVPLEWQIVGIGDVNADDKADIIWRHTNGVTALWLMDNLTLTSVGFLGGTEPEWEIAGFGDMDGNGTTDVVWHNRGNDLVGVWLMNGTSIEVSGFVAGMSPAWHIAQVDDANGDGMADVIWHNRSTAQVAVWLMNGLTVTSTEFPGTT